VCPLHTPQHTSYPECSQSVSQLSLADSGSNMEASDSSDGFLTWRHTPSPGISDSGSGLSSSVSDSGSIVSQSSTSAPSSALQQIPSSELSDSHSAPSFSTSSSVSEVPESSVKLKSLEDSLSGLGSGLSSESLY